MAESCLGSFQWTVPQVEQNKASDKKLVAQRNQNVFASILHSLNTDDITGF